MKKQNKMNFWKAIPALAAFVTVSLASFSAAAEALLGQPTPKGLGLQPAASVTKEKIEEFHFWLLVLCVVISLFVLALLLIVVFRFNEKRNPVASKTTHNVPLEILWTALPVVILVIMAIPSMKLIYFADKTHDAEMTLKVTGYQWYWGYEYPDHGGINFLANLDREKEPRLLATDNVVVLPVEINIRILTTASDVLHALGVPALGLKLDAVPGRLNETWVRITKEGDFYGQCSELCGKDHGFMPIHIKAVSHAEFADWVIAQGGKMPETTTEEQKAGE